MKSSRYSYNSNFSGLSQSYSDWNNSRIIKEVPQKKPPVFLLIVVFTTLICLQVYYIAKDREWEFTFRHVPTILILTLIVLIFVSAARWVLANQDKRDLRTIPLIKVEDLENQQKLITKQEINKLRKNPLFIKNQKKSRKSSSVLTKQDEDFRLDIESNEDEIFNFSDDE